MHTLGNLLEKEGFGLFYSSSKRFMLWRLLDMLWVCFKNRKKVDMVLIDTYSTLNFYYALLISQCCRILKLKYIPILHGGNLENRLKNNPQLCRLLFSNSYKLVSPSLFLQEVFKTYGYREVDFVPNSIDIQNYKFQEPQMLSAAKLLWVRSFSSIYNPNLAVKVLKLLKDEAIEVELCMVGPDSDGSLQTVKNLARQLGVSVRFTGKLTKEAWIKLAADYNIFLNTTNFDNMPVSVIEAMALGLPIVSTNVGGMPFLIASGTDGLLVPPNDEYALAVAVKQLLHQPVFAKSLAINARKKVEQFDWELVKQKWFEVLS